MRTATRPAAGGCEAALGGNRPAPCREPGGGHVATFALFIIGQAGHTRPVHFNINSIAIRKKLSAYVLL